MKLREVIAMVVLAAGIVCGLGFLVGRSFPVHEAKPETAEGTPADERQRPAPRVDASNTRPPRQSHNVSGTRSLAQRIQDAKADPQSLAAFANDLKADFKAGRITAQELATAFAQETDDRIMEVLTSALKEDPRGFLDGGVLSQLATIIQGDSSISRRIMAVSLLSQISDPSGQCKQALLAAAWDPSEIAVQLAALKGLKDLTNRNPLYIPEVTGQLMSIAKSATDERIVSEAVNAIHPDDDGTVRDMLMLLRTSSSLNVRLACAHVLESVRPANRGVALGALEQSYMNESSTDARYLLLRSIVRAGRSDAVRVLEKIKDIDPLMTSDCTDYAAILRTGEVDWEKIQLEKARLQAERAR